MHAEAGLHTVLHSLTFQSEFIILWNTSGPGDYTLAFLLSLADTRGMRVLRVVKQVPRRHFDLLAKFRSLICGLCHRLFHTR